MKEIIDALSWPRAYIDAVLLLAAVLLALQLLGILKSQCRLAHTGWIVAGLWLYIPVWLIDNICRAFKYYDYYNPPGAYLWLLWGGLRIFCLILLCIGLFKAIRSRSRLESANHSPEGTAYSGPSG